MNNASEPNRRAVLAATAAAGAYALAASVGTAALAATQPGEGAEDTAIRPFRIEVPDEALVDLRRRIGAMRWPERETVADESQGIQLAALQEVAHYWRTGYDWRKAEAKHQRLAAVRHPDRWAGHSFRSRSFET
jgi:hypothetical protein